MVYFVHQRGHLLDSRCEAPVPLTDLATAVTEARIAISLVGSDAMYEMAASVDPMVSGFEWFICLLTLFICIFIVVVMCL